MSNGTDPVPTLDQELYPALIQCFFIIGMGYIAGQLNLLSNTHSIGLSRYVSNFALPAVIFKNLVDVQFQSVSWRFLASVLIAKTIIFVFNNAVYFHCGTSEELRQYGSVCNYDDPEQWFCVDFTDHRRCVSAIASGFRSLRLPDRSHLSDHSQSHWILSDWSTETDRRSTQTPASILATMPTDVQCLSKYQSKSDCHLHPSRCTIQYNV